MNHYTSYLKADGRITMIRIAAEPPPDTTLHGSIEGEWSPDVYYVPGGTVLQRQPLPATMNTTTITLGQSATLSGLPVPCTVEVDGVMVPVADGTLVLAPTTVGSYRVSIDEVAYQRMAWTLEVSA
jgi:hypothetical protein